jgi:inosine-uridine nucleoside N-ribohydrolase
MGGTLLLPGNVTPVAGISTLRFHPYLLEFNIGTDPEAASMLFSLTSTTSETHPSALRLSRPLKLVLLPLDATHLHGLPEEYYKSKSKPALDAGSPLASFLDAMLLRTYKKVRSLVSQGRESDTVELHMHDPLCVYYAMLSDVERAKWVVESKADVRIECAGTLTRGMTLLDMRTRGKRPFEKKAVCSDDVEDGEDTIEGGYEGVDDDEGGWRGNTGNALDVVWASSSVEGGNMKSVEVMGELLWNLQ